MESRSAQPKRMPLLNVGRVSLDFPFPPYECQEVYMEKVVEALEGGKNALLESPTGTGKTLCLLCSSLAWQQKMRETTLELGYEDPAIATALTTDGLGKTAPPSTTSSNSFLKPAPLSSAPKKTPTIIYASRTHSQLVQVIRELKATVYRPRMSILGSREQLCIHPQVSRLTGAQQNRRCGALTSDRACRFKNNLTERGSSACGSVMDIEELHEHGKAHMVCPYYLVRDQIETAELVLMPYNYLIDPDSRDSVRINWENAVVIVDEAHNIEGAAAEAASFDLTSAITSGCIQDLQALLKEMKANKGLHPAAASSSQSSSTDINRPASLPPPTETDLCNLIQMLANLEAAIESEPLPRNSTHLARPGSFIFDLLARAGVTMASKQSYLLSLQKALNAVLDRGESREMGKASGARLEALLKALRCVFRGEAQDCFELSKLYRVVIQAPKQGTGTTKDKETGRTVSFWCFSPSILMRNLEALHVRSVILTSGTLTPMASFAHELSVPFPITLENKHVIKPNQLWVGVVTKGCGGEALSSSFERRSDTNYLSDLGETVAKFCSVIPGGVLVFFPSYGVMDQCLKFWRRNPNLWARISAHKPPMTEPKESAALKLCLGEYDSLIKERGAAVLFAVCRGKVSEGMDFADNRARAVLITGIPFPPAKDPKIEQKKDYLDKMQLPSGVQRLRGMDWYVQQASRAVNQAVGRVIRHRLDYGAVILLDERFTGENQRQGLSSWIRPWVKVYDNCKEAESQLQDFFEGIAKDPRLHKGPRPRVKVDVRGSSRDGRKLSESSAAVVVSGVEEDASYVDPQAIKQVVAPNGILQDETSVARLKQWKASIQQQDRGGQSHDSNAKGSASSLSSLLTRKSQAGEAGRSGMSKAGTFGMKASSGSAVPTRLGLGASGLITASNQPPKNMMLGLNKNQLSKGPLSSLQRTHSKGLVGSSSSSSLGRSIQSKRSSTITGHQPPTPRDEGEEQPSSTASEVEEGGAGWGFSQEPDVDVAATRAYVLQAKITLSAEDYVLFTAKFAELRKGAVKGHKEFVAWAHSVISLVVKARAPLSLLHDLNRLFVQSQALRNTFQQVMATDIPPTYRPLVEATPSSSQNDPTMKDDTLNRAPPRPPPSSVPKGWVPNKRSRLILGLASGEENEPRGTGGSGIAQPPKRASSSSSSGDKVPKPTKPSGHVATKRGEPEGEEEDDGAGMVLSQRTLRDRDTYQALQSLTEVQVPTYVRGKTVGECAICCNKAVMYMSKCHHLACNSCWQKQVKTKGQCFNRCKGTIRMSDLQRVYYA